MNRLVIYTQGGATLKFDNVKNLNWKSDTLFFEITGYAGDEGKSLFKNVAGYTLYKKEDN